MAAPSVDYGFDTTLMPPAAAPSTQALGQPTVIGDSPQDADSAPIAPPAAPADTDSTPIAPPVASGDTDSTPIESPIPPLSDAELQAKMKRWGPMLSGDSMATPADLVEMQSSGKFTPGQLQRAQTESSLRQTYIQQQARTLGQKVGAGLSSGWDTVKNIAQDVTPGLRDYQTYQELAANPQADITENRGRVANSLLEGGYGAAAGVGSLAKGLLTGPLSYLKNAITGPRTAAQSEQDYQDWKKDYIATHAVPGYAPPAPSEVQNAESYYTGVAPENLPAPAAPLVSLASTVASIPAFGAAAGLGEAAIPKILAATGAEAIAPNLSKLLIPTTAAAKLKGAMSDALTKGAGEAATPALDTAATKGLPTTPATPEQAAAIQAANPSLLDRVNAAGKPISDKVDSAIAGIKALPGNLAEATAGVVSKAGEVAQAPAGVLDKLFAKLPSGDTPVSSYIRYKFLDHIPFFGQAVQAVKALEGAGKLTAGLGDFMERMATANPLDPMGRFAAAAEAAPAGHWMKAVVNNPALRMALKVGTFAAAAAAATAKGAAAGAALGVASNQSPEEIGQAAGGLAAFSGAHGAMSAGQARILDAQIGGVAKVVTDHIAGGGSPDTLKLVPASDILTAANLKSALPDYTVRFATDSDGTKPPVAQGQAGYYDRANKTLWIDPENRVPGSTILHEAFHPIFDQLVAEQPNVKAALDQALARNGDSIDRFKLEYANRVAEGDPGQASDYIAGQDKANPDWAYSEMLSEAASHALDGKDLLQAMQGNDVQQSATQTALQGVEGWLSDNGVDLQQRQNTGTIFPDFKDSFNDPDLRRLTYRLLKAQRDSLFSRTPEEAPGTPLTSAAMGGAVAPTYNENGRQINQYGEVKDTPTGKKFVPFPASEIRRRMNAEKVALPKYFPEVGKLYTSLPAGILADTDVTPWTKNTLKTMFDAKENQHTVSFWNQGLSGKKAAVSDVTWARQTARDLGNVEARYQKGRLIGARRTKANNLTLEVDSEEAEDQRLANWSKQHGPISLDLWGGNQAAAKADIETYKKNLAANLPGETGLSVDKKNVLNALLAGDNKEFQASNPLRSMLKKKDRAATFRSFRPERVGAITAEPTDVPAVKWERAKANLSPAAAEEVKEPPKREIMLTGPDGKQYPAKYDGMMSGWPGQKFPWTQITPQVDLPGSMGKGSTTYAHSLEKQGYTLPADLKAEVDKYNAANPPQPMQFSASDDPRAVRSAAVRDEETGRVYTGAIHAEALVNYLNDKHPESETRMVIGGAEDYPVTAGFVTNNGKFLDREQAYKRAVELKQYKGKPTVAAYDDEAPSGLEAIRFNRQQPMQFSASDDPHAIASAAVQDEDTGKIYVGSDHGSAAQKAPTGRASNLIDGYVTNSGKFLDRDTAFKQAVALKQYKPGPEDRNINQELYGLTSERFNKQNPNTYAGMQRAKAALAKKENFSPSADPEIRDQAAEYSKEQGLTAKPHTAYARLNEDLGKRVADAYEAAPHIPDDPKVQASYKAMADETRKQWDFLTNKGVTFEPWTKEGQPYANSADMRDDVQQNKHLYFFPTAGGYGAGEEVKSNNPMLAPTGDPKAPVVNDMFRAVHDYFGHAKEGYEFGPRGEYNAYLTHSKMFSKAAIPALTAETMGQNSWVNFGKHLRDEAGNIPKKGEAGYKSPTERPYAAQKATALPDELTQESLNPKVQFSPAQPETISRAAVRVDKEHTFESDSHSGAYAKARKAGLITEDDQGGPRTEEGFKTSAGRFVDRAEGYRLASAANQVNTREPALTDNGRWLDSSNVKAFSPAAKEQEKLSYPMEMTPGHNTGVLPGLLKAPYDVRERYQADMLKAMEPLFAAFGAKPGATTKSSYKNSAGETEHNPATAVEVPAQDAKLFGLLHGHFARQEAVAGGFQETSPGKWEPVGPHSFDVQPTGGETFADKIKEMGPQAEAMLAKLQPIVGPAVESVNKKYSGLHSHQLSPSQDPRAVKRAAVKDETTGKVYTGSYHGEAFEKYLAKNPGASLDVGEDEEDNGGIYGAPAHLKEGFVTNKGDFLDRQEALERAMEMKQYKDASPDKDYGLESVSFESQKKMGAKPDQFSPSEEPSEPAPFVPTGVLKHRGNNPAKAAAAVADAKPGQPIALGTFSPPQMSDKAFEKLAGKKMLFIIGDQARAGQDYITASGKSAGVLMGGPGYPHMPEMQGKAGWAINKQHITRLAKAFKNVDYMAVFAGSPDMSLGSISFARAYLAELKDAVESGAVKSGVLDRLAREAGRRVRMGKTKSGNLIDIPVIHNFSELEDLVTPTLEGRRGPRATENAKGVSFEARSSLFKILGSFTNNKKFGTPLLNAIRDIFNETGAFEPGQLMQIIQINREKPIAPAAEHGVPEHPSYTQVIPGTGLGQPPKKLMMADVLKPWAESGPAAKQGGNLDYKVRMNMPETEINPAVFEKK